MRTNRNLQRKSQLTNSRRSLFESFRNSHATCGRICTVEIPTYDNTLKIFSRLTAALVVLFSATNVSSARADDTVYRDRVLPILETRCGHCHGADVQEAEIRFDQLSTDLFGNRAAAQKWREALNAINAGEMPPEDEPQLTTDEIATVTTWISSAIEKAIARQRSTGGRGVLRRLNRMQYQNTMRDLLGLDMDYTRDLPPDAISADGFRNNGQSLRMSSIQLEYYLDTARRAMEKVIVHGVPPRVFRHNFDRSNVGGWRGPTEKSNRLERSQKFLAKIVDDYPELGEFRIRVRTRAELKPDKGFPILEVAVGYRPDTEVHFAICGTCEVVSEDVQQFEFRGRIENFPLPVRGQGKYPGLVIRLRNVYTDGTPAPSKLEKVRRDGKEVQVFPAEPHMPALLIESVEFEGPYNPIWPPKIHRQILFDSPLRNQNEVAWIREVLQRFMTRAYRRPATRAEVERMFAFFADIRPHYTRFEDAIRETLSMVLIQPEFLYLMESSEDTKRELNDWELASRLSYFLWSTMPDQQLFDMAERNRLTQPNVLRAEIDRMLDDPRAKRFTRDFAKQWLLLYQLDHLAVDREYYPQFSAATKRDMVEETIALFEDLISNNGSTLNLLDSDYALLNEKMARHYGIPDVFGSQFRRVPVGERRGGLLGQASILTLNSTGKDSHPIRRAVWIRDRLLNDPPAPPPPDVPELDEASDEFASLSVREQLAVHRERESCAACHRNIDPWGIALENFDAVGRWREGIRKKNGDKFEERPLVNSDVLPDGTKLNGAIDLRKHLVTDRLADFARALTRALTTYALGRSLELSDEAEVDDLADQFVKEDYRIRPLIHAIVDSEAFRTK